MSGDSRYFIQILTIALFAFAQSAVAVGFQVPRIEAENFSAKSENRLENNIQNIETFGVGFIVHGDWLRFDDVDFGEEGVNHLNVRYGSAGSGGNLRIRTGGPDGPIHASVYLPPTGDWLAPNEETTAIEGLAGVQTIWMTFDGPLPYVLFALDRFEFELFAEDTSGNIAIGKQTTQSDGGNSNLAADGDFESDIMVYPVEEQYTFWEVDFGANYSIGEIKVWNSPSLSESLSGYNVMIIDRNDKVIWNRYRAEVAGRTTSFIVGGVHGRKVRVQLDEPNTMRLAEVEIFSQVPNEGLILAPDQSRLPRLEFEYPNDTHGNFGVYRYDDLHGEGLIITDSPESAYRLYQIYDSNWVRFDNIDFGEGVGKMWINYVVRHQERGGGWLRIRTGSETGPIHGTVFLPRTGGRSFIGTASSDVTNLQGIKTIWITFEGREIPLFELDWIEFDP
jgi:hypothetical protein